MNITISPNKYRPLARLTVLIAASLVCGLAAPAAIITWNTPQYISGDSDVSTTGTLVAAYSLNQGAAVINGVGFSNAQATFTSLTNSVYGTNFLLSVFADHYALFGAGTTNPFAGLSTSYKTLLSNGVYGGSISGGVILAVPVVTATNLTFGHQYLLQVWANDSRTGRAASDYSDLSSPGGNDVPIYYNDNGGAGGVGQYAIGNFIADGNTQPFSIVGNPASGQTGDTYLNAVQIRDLGMAPNIGIGFWNGLAGNNVLDTTSLNFCTNASSLPVGTAASLTTVSSLTNACYFYDAYYNNSSLVAVTSTNLAVAAGGISIGSVNFMNSAVTYTLTSSDANGITGSTAVYKSGTGTLILDGANSYTGGTVISSGTVQVGNGDGNGSLGSGPVANDALLVFNRTDSPTIVNNISGEGVVNVASPGTVTLGGAISGAGILTESGSGSLILSGSDTFTGKMVISSNDGNSLSITGQLNSSTYPNTVSIASNSLFNYDSSSSLTMSGVISGAGALSQTGPGTLILSGANTYTGGTAVGPGSTLQLNTGGTTTGAGGGNVGAITINGNGVLTLNMGNSEMPNPMVGGASSILNINLSTGNEWITNVASLTNFQGAINVNYSASGGQLVVGNGATINVPINPNATWHVNTGTVVDFNGLQTNTATVNLYGLPYASAADGALRLDESVQSGNVILNGNSEIGNGNTTGVSTITGAISDTGGSYGFIKTGANPIVLLGVNTYHGATIISNGTLRIGAGGSIANSSGILLAPGTLLDVFSNSSFTIGSSQTLAAIAGGSGTIDGNVTMASGASLILTNSTGAPSLIITNGTLTLNNNPVTVTVTPFTTPTANGYLLISAGTGGAVAGSVASSGVTVNGLANNTGTPALAIVSGSLYLTFTGYPQVVAYSPYTFNNNDLFAYVGAPGPTYSVTALGAGLSYYWYSNNVLVAGANNSSFMPVTTSLPAQALPISCVVSNSSGTATQSWVFNILSTNGIAPYPAVTMLYGPVAYWRLDEPDDGANDGNAGRPCSDYAGGNYTTYTNADLSYTLGYSPSSDPTEYAAEFGLYKTTGSYAGVIPAINFPPATSPAAGAANGVNVNFTIECWEQAPSSIAGSTTFVTEGYYNTNDIFSLSVNSTKQFRFYCRNADGSVINAQANGSGDFTAKTADGNWHFLAGVLAESNGVATASIYVDGQLEGQTSGTTGTGEYAITPTPYVSIATAQNNSPTETLNVTSTPMNEVAIFTTNLTAAQIQAQFDATGVAPVYTITGPGGTNVNGGTINVDSGATLTLTADVTAGTPPLTYIWIDGNTSLPIPGQTNTTLSVTNVTANDYYALEVTNIFSPNPPPEPFVSINVVSGAPSFAPYGHDIFPASAAVYVGNPVTFSVLAYGSYPLYYQWFNGASPISGATNASFTTNASLGTNFISCTVTNSFNVGSPITSSTASLVGISLPTDFYGQTILSNSPIAYWRLNEQDNGSSNGNPGVTAYDYIGQHDAHYYNVELGVPGLDTPEDTNSAALFGVYATPNSFAEENGTLTNPVPNIDFSSFGMEGSTAEFSVEAWVKADGTQPSSTGIVSRGYTGEEQFQLDVNGGDFRFYLRDSVLSIFSCQSAVAADTNWHHLVGVCDEGNGASYLYVDGVLQISAFGMQAGKSVIEPGQGNKLSSLVNIGARAASSTATTLADQFKGTIQEVALYNYALSSNQVALHYAAGVFQPLSPFSITSVTNVAGTSVTLTWQSVSGHTYQVQATPALSPTNWISLVTNVATGTTMSYTDTSTNATAPASYYRVVGY